MKTTWSKIQNQTRLCGLICSVLIAGGAMTLLSGCGSGGGSTTIPTPIATPTPPPTPTPTPNSATRDAPRSLFGQWRLVNTSGGITGNGYVFTPGAEGITFNENGTFSRLSDGQVTQGTYQVTVASFYTGSGAQVSTGGLNSGTPPIITYSTTTQTESITLVSDTRLTLSERAADGYAREYERVINTAN